MKKRIFTLIGLILIVLSMSSCGKEKEEYLTGKHNVEITVKDMGKIKVELDADAAPITTTNFVNLVNEGFYDGLTFHRVVEGFMIQGGDPNGDGTGGSGKNIKGEFEDNGIKNTISHKRGTISMGRTAYDYDSASSQFFIVHKDSTDLDGHYAAFGKVTDGMDIVDKIAKIKVENEETGFVSKSKQPVIESIKVVENRLAEESTDKESVKK